MAPPFCKQYQTPFYDNDSIITFETMGTGDVWSLPIFRDVRQIFGARLLNVMSKKQNELPLIWHDVNYLGEVCTLKGVRD